VIGADAFLVVGTGIAALCAVALIWRAGRDDRMTRERRYESALIDIVTDPRCASRDEMVARAVEALGHDVPSFHEKTGSESILTPRTDERTTAAARPS
jgi:hypothetical protein